MYLQKYGIHKWEIVDGKVYINQDVDISGKSLTEFPFEVYAIRGNLFAKGNRFTSLKNFPRIVEKIFDVSYNSLETLEGFPEVVYSAFLESNRLQSLKGIIPCINGVLDISNNPLKNLDFAPLVKTRAFTNSLDIDKVYLEIYHKSLEEGKWNPSLTFHENVKLLSDLSLKTQYVHNITERYGI